MTTNKVYRKNGDLTVQFTFKKNSSMLEMEEQIESFLYAIDEDVSVTEKNNIRIQLLQALKENI